MNQSTVDSKKQVLRGTIEICDENDKELKTVAQIEISLEAEAELLKTGKKECIRIELKQNEKETASQEHDEI